MMSMNFIAILKIKSTYYYCVITGVSKVKLEHYSKILINWKKSEKL